MSSLYPSMRMKVKGDTFFLPEPDGSVYFRNNIGSFRLEGKSIAQWIEKLMPVFNGEHTLEDLTDGLPDLYKERVYEIAEMLYKNGFVRDVSQDLPHHLPEEIVKRYAAQIEFLNSFGDSGAYRFQTYRQAKVLAVGSGPFFVALVSALLDSGLPKFDMCVTDPATTNRQRMEELVAVARTADPEIEVKELVGNSLQNEEISSLLEATRPYEAILYVSEAGDVERLRKFQGICTSEEKMFIPAICFQGVGLAGPLVHPGYEGDWESAWRRMHNTVLHTDSQQDEAFMQHSFSSTAGALLANVIVFELLKTITGINEPEQKNKFYLLNLETLEGNWHTVLPHPFVRQPFPIKQVDGPDQLIKQCSHKGHSNTLLPYFDRLTSETTGIFHIWEEGELYQLPLSQCRVQAVDPLSEGPASMLSALVCCGLTHEEARREAGLAGIEDYVSRLIGYTVDKSFEFVGVGAGQSKTDAVCRGLQKCLLEELRKQKSNQKVTIIQMQLDMMEDELCKFYLQALTDIQGKPLIGLGNEVAGFPVVWVGTNGRWYGSTGLNLTFALRHALQQALHKQQNQVDQIMEQAVETGSVNLKANVMHKLIIPACAEGAQQVILEAAYDILKRNGRRLLIFDFALEPFLQEELAGVFGVQLREGDLQ